jgi:hypothetical protein
MSITYRLLPITWHHGLPLPMLIGNPISFSVQIVGIDNWELENRNSELGLQAKSTPQKILRNRNWGKFP